jgi:Zn-dependent peptidase ImmA (M78 family)
MPKNPYQHAADLLSKLEIQSAPTPVEKIARAMNAQVRFAPFDDDLSGMIYIKDGVPIIGVNALHHPNRQRFTLAHELGHLELHRAQITAEVHVDKEFPILMRDPTSATGTERIEIEANQFAAALLMPRALLDQALEGVRFDDIEDDGPLEELAKKFRVSRQALEYRIRNRE